MRIVGLVLYRRNDINSNKNLPSFRDANLILNSGCFETNMNGVECRMSGDERKLVTMLGLKFLREED